MTMTMTMTMILRSLVEGLWVKWINIFVYEFSRWIAISEFENPDLACQIYQKMYYMSKKL